MKKSRYFFGAALSVALVAGMSSCTGKNANNAEMDSAEVAAVADTIDVATPTDSIAAIFDDAAKASEVATDSTTPLLRAV